MSINNRNISNNIQNTNLLSNQQSITRDKLAMSLSNFTELYVFDLGLEYCTPVIGSSMFSVKYRMYM